MSLNAQQTAQTLDISYRQLCDLVASVQHGRPRSLSLVEHTLEAVRAFVSAEIASSIDVVLSAPTLLESSEDEEEGIRI